MELLQALSTVAYKNFKISELLLLYRTNVSDLVRQDFDDNSFNIKYQKSDNTLQTMTIKKEKDENSISCCLWLANVN